MSKGLMNSLILNFPTEFLGPQFGISSCPLHLEVMPEPTRRKLVKMRFVEINESVPRVMIEIVVVSLTREE